MDKLSKKYESCLKKAEAKLQLAEVEKGSIITQDYEDFMNALADDLNVANALSVLDREVKEINGLVAKKDASFERLGQLVATIEELYEILGLKYEIPQITSEDRKLVEQFNEARANKDYAKSDELRPIMMEKGLL